ncbi:putative vegetative incompatibility protein [Cladorrhinum sp. PSN259]|nr:putative vegetative incompatibility protein [Cladorrhinum sp. PSN259]
MRLLKLLSNPSPPNTTVPIKTEEYFEDYRPPYAILSHSWGSKNDELTLQELLNPLPDTHEKVGFQKVLKTCELALSHDKLNKLEYSWVDTCCIDKTSSSELAEAISSMYAWYAEAEVCYVYLSDLAPIPAGGSLTVETLGRCRWFYRGWTLQELIAPQKVIFFDQKWNELGDKKELSGIISKITGVPVAMLNHSAELSDYSVARRMSWASKRKTTRIEDTAYCLLGIFGVNMSFIYGEGMKAFGRLQEIILRETADLSIFVWTDKLGEVREFAPLLANSPSQFSESGDVTSVTEDTIYRDLTISSRGINLSVSLIHMPEQNDKAYLCILDIFCYKKGSHIGIGLRKISGGRYARFNTGLLPRLAESHGKRPWRDIFRMLVEPVHLPVSFPPRFPFYPTDHPVLGNRNSVLSFRWCEPAPPLRFTVDWARPVPRSHWDVHDQVFFSSNNSSKSWCALFVHGRLYRDVDDLPDGGFIPVNFFIGCHRWNICEPHTYICSLHDVNPDVTISLETQLDRTLFEACRQAEATLLTILDGKMGTESTIVETGVVDQASVESAVPKMPVGYYGVGGVQRVGDTETARAGWHSKFQYSGDKVRVKVSVELNRDKDEKLCVASEYPITRLDVRFEIIGKEPTWQKLRMEGTGNEMPMVGTVGRRRASF